MNYTTTNDRRDNKVLVHSAQRAKNPNTARAIKMTSANAPTVYDHNTATRDDSDAHSQRFIYTGVTQQPRTAEKMSARHLMQYVTGSAAN